MNSNPSQTPKSLPVTLALFPLTGAPVRRSSGQRKGKPQVSHMANKKVKSLLHLGAMSAIQHCTQLKAYYQRKVKEGKNKMLPGRRSGAQ
jgi:transposase